ncbi:HCNGP-like protein-domain-containing protein [Aspergillus unguis]
MLGLGNYESSSEDEAEKQPSPNKKQELRPSQVEASQTQNDNSQQASLVQTTPQQTTLDQEPSGPVLGPTHEENGVSDATDGQSSTSRLLIHDLTLPPVPNLDIPPSPPGSPNPSANAKFAHFLNLKKQDVHFNDKLASSVSLKNPSLLKKMMEHAGIDEQAQYSNSLPSDLWDTSTLPSWGYKEELLKVQRELNAKAEERKSKGPRDTIEFVSDSSQPSSASQSTSRPR